MCVTRETVAHGGLLIATWPLARGADADSDINVGYRRASAADARFVPTITGRRVVRLARGIGATLGNRRYQIPARQ